MTASAVGTDPADDASGLAGATVGGLPASQAAEETASDAGAEPDARGRPPVVAYAKEVRLRAPTTSFRWVRFAEGRRAGAFPLVPVGELVSNDVPELDTPPDRAGPRYSILEPAGRGRPATSAVMFAAAADEWVTSVVTGTVDEVIEYPRDDHRDWQVRIAPEQRPELQAVITGLHRPRVSVGEEVTAGRTRLALPRLHGGDGAVISVELVPAVRLGGFDPHAPARPAEETLDG